MKYAISLLRTEGLEYEEERYDTFEEAEKAFLKISNKKRADFGIAEVHTPEEIQQMNLDEVERTEREKEREKINLVEVVYGNGFIELRGIKYVELK